MMLSVLRPLGRWAAALAASLLLATACTYSHGEPEVVAPCNVLPATGAFATVISPIIQVNCRDGCHNATDFVGGVNFDSFSELQRYALSGSIVRRIERAPDHPDFMPKDRPKLPACDIERIKAWVAVGAPAN